MSIDDRQRELSTVLSYLVGRPLRTAELAKDLGISRSSYYTARDEGRLSTADNLLRLAAALGLNPVDLLIRYGLLSHDAVLEYLSTSAPPAPPDRPARTPRPQPRSNLPPLTGPDGREKQT